MSGNPEVFPRWRAGALVGSRVRLRRRRCSPSGIRLGFP